MVVGVYSTLLGYGIEYMTEKRCHGEYDVGNIQGWHMHQGVDHGYHDLPCQAVSIEGVQKLLQGMPAVRSISSLFRTFEG